jgi:isopenicillin N synthase-like dioxygenase
MAFSAALSHPCPANVLQHAPGQSADRKRFLNPSLHAVPSVANNNGADGMSNSSGSRDRNLSVLRDKSERSVQERFTEHVTESPKVVALKLAKVGKPISPHTVKAHQQRLPDTMETFFAYCRAYPGFALDALELMGIDLDMQRDAYAQFIELQRRIRGQ